MIQLINNPNQTPSLLISTPSSSVCAGANVTLTAVPTNGGFAPSYQWKLNGLNIGTNSNTFSSSSFANADNITCILTSNASCLSINTATSNSITITINPATAPSVSVAGNSTICAGANVNFTATPTNGGATPSYQWKLNGTNVGINASVYANNNLNNGDIVSCVMTTSNACASIPTANSNIITMTVNPSVIPTVSIGVVSSNICAGANASFTATPVNGGVSPSYQWKINGNNTGTNSNLFATSALLNGLEN